MHEILPTVHTATEEVLHKTFFALPSCSSDYQEAVQEAFTETAPKMGTVFTSSRSDHGLAKHVTYTIPVSTDAWEAKAFQDLSAERYGTWSVRISDPDKAIFDSTSIKHNRKETTTDKRRPRAQAPTSYFWLSYTKLLSPEKRSAERKISKRTEQYFEYEPTDLSLAWSSRALAYGKLVSFPYENASRRYSRSPPLLNNWKMNLPLSKKLLAQTN